MKRIIDFLVSAFSMLLLIPIFIVIAILIFAYDGGQALHWSKRIGKNNKIFLMPKFRSMQLNTPQLATHLINGRDFITPVGKFLRKSSLDELPQLWSVVKGDMSLVGPRPALYNQDDLKEMRSKRGIHTLRPGITGWAQINGRDEISLEKKVALDYEYLLRQGFIFDLKILFLTVLRAFAGQGVSH